jgi:hypothetical protein
MNQRQFKAREGLGQLEQVRAVESAERARELAKELELAESAAEAGDFVKMTKTGHDSIDVHPTCVASHVRAGWHIVR